MTGQKVDLDLRKTRTTMNFLLPAVVRDGDRAPGKLSHEMSHISDAIESVATDKCCYIADSGGDSAVIVLKHWSE